MANTTTTASKAKPGARKRSTAAKAGGDETLRAAREAIEWVCQVMPANPKPTESIYRAHMLIGHGVCTGTDGVVAAGMACPLDMVAAPHAKRLKDALERCAALSDITLGEGNQLAIESGKYRARVPCCDVTLITQQQPDPNIAVVNDRIRDAMVISSQATQESADEVLLSTVLLQANTCVGTNRHVVIEAMHGIDLPPNLIVPMVFVKAIARVKKELKGFGFTPGRCLTLHYADGSWLRTQLYETGWPHDILSTIFEGFDNAWPGELKEEFFMAVDSVRPFGDGKLYFLNDKGIATEEDFDAARASYGYPIVGSSCCNGDYLRFGRGHTTHASFGASRIFMRGEHVRVAIGAIPLHEQATWQPPPSPEMQQAAPTPQQPPQSQYAPPQAAPPAMPTQGAAPAAPPRYTGPPPGGYQQYRPADDAF